MSDTATAESGAQTSAPSIDDRLSAFFAREPAPVDDASSPEPQPEPPAAEAQAESQDAEITDEVTPDDIPADDETPAPQTVGELEITWNGETVKVAKDEAKNLAQLGYHLTKAREQVTSELETARTQAQHITQAVAAIQQTAPQLQQVREQMAGLVMLANSKGLTPQAIYEVAKVDPARAVEMRAEYDALDAQYKHLELQSQTMRQQLDQQQSAVRQQMEQAEYGLLMKLNPNLRDPVQFKRSKELLAAQIGKWRPESVKTATENAEILDLLIDGAKYRSLQAGKREKMAVANKAPQVAKPGSGTSQTPQRVQEVRSLRTKLKQTGSVEDAQRLLMRMK